MEGALRSHTPFTDCNHYGLAIMCKLRRAHPWPVCGAPARVCFKSLATAATPAPFIICASETAYRSTSRHTSFQHVRLDEGLSWDGHELRAGSLLGPPRARRALDSTLPLLIQIDPCHTARGARVSAANMVVFGGT
ncbi:hypothetical protein B0H10DRAFT_2219171 [Mycena sp. CBHHK59/15]|nr:hypothetical protein B0H10DRAFT_2219171 [Mycena sp. CBHHK59/15]